MHFKCDENKPHVLQSATGSEMLEITKQNQFSSTGPIYANQHLCKLFIQAQGGVSFWRGSVQNLLYIDEKDTWWRKFKLEIFRDISISTTGDTCGLISCYETALFGKQGLLWFTTIQVADIYSFNIFLIYWCLTNVGNTIYIWIFK